MSAIAYQASIVLLEYVPIQPRDRTICKLIADVVIIQSIFVFVGSGSILYCVWNPDLATLDYDKLVRIMYLFDSSACGYKLQMSKDKINLHFSNETHGFNVLPIAQQQQILIGSTRLSAKTRRYIQISLAFHCIWVVMAIILRVYAKNCFNLSALKFVLAVFFYSCIFMVMFDTSMALVYIAHIKRSLTKNMILRYSGWSATIKLHSYDNFAGWLPILASIAWMRGIIILMLNIYCCRMLKRIMRKIKRREINLKYENECYRLIPEPRPVYLTDKALVYRNNVKEPNQF